MTSRKHCRIDDEEEVVDASKRVCSLDGDEHGPLEYNPSFVTEHRTCTKLPGYTVDELRKIARIFGLNPKGMSKVELVSAIRTCPL